MHWDTIQLQRGDMLLMVATSRHHGMPALPDSKDGLQGALFNSRHRHHQPNTTHLDPPPPRARPWPLLGICPASISPVWTMCCGWGRGWLGGWGCGRSVLPRPSSPTPPRRSRRPPPPAPTSPPSSPPPPGVDIIVTTSPRWGWGGGLEPGGSDDGMTIAITISSGSSGKDDSGLQAILAKCVKK